MAAAAHRPRGVAARPENYRCGPAAAGKTSAMANPGRLT